MKPFTVTAMVAAHGLAYDDDGRPATLVTLGSGYRMVSDPLPFRASVPGIELTMPAAIADEFFPLRSKVSITIACEKESSND